MVDEGRSAIAVDVPLIAGYTFTGWSDSSFVKVTKNLNVYAVYSKSEDDNVGVTVSGKQGDYAYVELGLPSGLKWATCNVGATKPTEFGDYFAWGETEPKENYSWSTYKWCENKKVDENGYPHDFSKYVMNSEYGQTDSLMVLEAADDAVTANWGRSWRMPTWTEINELISGCEWVWTDDFNGSGVSGEVGTSKANGNTIFLPAAGVRFGTGVDYQGVGCDFWTSSLEDRSYYAYDLFIIKEVADWGDFFRGYGRSVRGVCR